MPALTAKALSKSFGDTARDGRQLAVVEHFDLELTHGGLATLFGPNGCGKTTILNMLAGFLQPDSGIISVNNGDPGCRSIGYVFQNYADTLLPWRTLRSNVAFPLELRRLRATERRRRVDDRLALFGLAEHAHKYIYELSGGLKQLAAIAQATIYDPSLLLLDEPFSALDYSRSRVLWKRFRELWQELHVSTVFVSHNVDEAIYLGDDVYVLSSRPTRVVERFRIPFGPRRELSILHSEEFMQLRSRVLCAFELGLS